MTDAARSASAPPPARFGAGRIAVVILLGLIAAWFFWDGLSSLVGLPQQFAALGIDDRVPWAALIAGVVAPPLIFAAGVVIARRQPIVRFTIVLFVALAVMATTRLSLIAVAPLLAGF